MSSRICILLLTAMLVGPLAGSKNLAVASPEYLENLSSPDSRLPKTTALERDFDQVKQSLASTKSRLKRAQKAAADGRRKAEEFKKVVSKLRSIESQIGRLETQLKSFSKIPTLKMLKPVVSTLKSVKSQVSRVRSKAAKVQKASIDPAIAKIRAFEKEASAAAKKIRGMEAQTLQARQQVSQLKSQVASLNYARPAVSTVESAAHGARGAVQPVKRGLQDFDRACADAESKLRSFTSSVSAAVSLKSGLDKLQKDLAPIDKKAKDLGKVLNKKLTFKNPFNKKKSKSYTIRQIIETPDKILKIATKPLTKLASKLLSPVTKKFKIKLKAPKEIQQLEQKLSSLQSQVVNLSNAQNQIRNWTRSQSIKKYEVQLTRFINVKASQLRR